LDNFESLPQPVFPSSITLRKEKDITDLTDYVAVYNEVFRDAFEFELRTEEKVRDFFDQMQKVLDIEHCFAFKGNKLVGMCYISNDPKEKVTGTINSLGVLSSYRHLGIGGALLAFGIQSLYEKGCKMIELSVMANNERALALYKKFVFYELKLRTQRIYTIK
ncbi:MAG: GNAT family N-acetyltransferase, partial [Promethearchaeota archaeon]